jgi:hypothetical protein
MMQKRRILDPVHPTGRYYSRRAWKNYKGSGRLEFHDRNILLLPRLCRDAGGKKAMSPADEQRFNEIVEGAEDNMWIVEGQIDLPVVLPQIEGKPPTSGICLDFSGGTGDGYIELRSADHARTQQSVWWSRNEPILFDFRASVIGHGLLNGWQRAMSFLDRALDRLSFLSGVPASLASVSMLYNETQLEACRRGERTHVDCAPAGIPTQNAQPLQNPHLVPNLKPSERCTRALRWFRKGLASEDPDDRFLAFYL